jgi:hypothetical protein
MVEYLEIQPLTEARIVNFGLAPPKLRRQRATNLEMVQLELDKLHLFRKITTNVLCAHEKANDFAPLDLSLD